MAMGSGDGDMGIINGLLFHLPIPLQVPLIPDLDETKKKKKKPARSFSKFLFTPSSETVTSQDPLMPEEVDPKLHMKDN